MKRMGKSQEMRRLLPLPKPRRLAKNNRQGDDVFGDDQAWIEHVTARGETGNLFSEYVTLSRCF